jgi:hypothetical protein
VSEKYRANLVKNSAKGKVRINTQVNDRIEQYNQNPKKCKQCNTPITYDRRRNNYCNQSCSASYNNKKRQKKDHSFYLKKYNQNPKKCQTFLCENVFSYEKQNRKKCDECKEKIRIEQMNKRCNINKSYRRLCNFTLNKKDYPSLYDNTLLKTYGWYSPSNKKNNLTGVSFDHLYRVEDGFKNNVPPEIMKHPANAELVPHNINQLRQKSTITLDELLLRIQLWDLGERNLKNYYKERGF